MNKQFLVFGVFILLIIGFSGCTEQTSDTNNDIIIETDTDGDGYPDNSDEFPSDPTEWLDSDNDGVGNNGDAFPHDSTEWKDSDGDGHGDNSDYYPYDKNKWKQEIPLRYEVIRTDTDEVLIDFSNWIRKFIVEIKNIDSIPGTFTVNYHIRTAKQDYSLTEIGYIVPGDTREIIASVDLSFGEDFTWSYQVIPPMKEIN